MPTRHGRAARPRRRPGPRSARGSPGSTASPRSPARSGSRDDLPRRRRAHAARRPVAARPGDASSSATSAPFVARAPGPRPGAHRRATCPGDNRYGIYPTGKDQPVLAEGVRPLPRRGRPRARRRRGDRRRDRGRRAADHLGAVLPPLLGIDAAPRPGAPRLHDASAGQRPRPRAASRAATSTRRSPAPRSPRRARSRRPSSSTRTSSPRPGRRASSTGGSRSASTTQTPYMDRDELALILGLPEDRVRVIPSACGGGFGGKLDLSIQPLHRDRRAGAPAARSAAVYSRPESMAATHEAPPGADRGDVRRRRRRPAHRRPLPRRLRHRRLRLLGPDGRQPRARPRDGPVRGAARCSATTRAVYTNGPPAGAFRGFGVPAGGDRPRGADGRPRRAARPRPARDPAPERAPRGLDDRESASGSRERRACPPASTRSRPHWVALRAEAAGAQRAGGARRRPLRRGVGIGAMWYGIGNTSLPNPSTIEIGRHARRHASSCSAGAVDIGQGSVDGPRPDRRRRPRRAGRGARARRAPTPT